MTRILGIAMVSLAALSPGAAAHAVETGDDAASNPAAWWLGKMDVDNDSRLGHDEFFAGREREFARLDTDHDGILGAEKREAAIDEWNRQHPAVELEFDNSDGDMDADEFASESEVGTANVAG